VRDNELEVSNIGQSMSSDVMSSSASYAPGSATSQLASADVLSNAEGGLESFYDDGAVQEVRCCVRAVRA
jgi:hypothetical protein